MLEKGHTYYYKTYVLNSSNSYTYMYTYNSILLSSPQGKLGKCKHYVFHFILPSCFFFLLFFSLIGSSKREIERRRGRERRDVEERRKKRKTTLLCWSYLTVKCTHTRKKQASTKRIYQKQYLIFYNY